MSIKEQIINKITEIKQQLIAEYPVPNEKVSESFLYEIDDHLEDVMEYVNSLDFEG